MATTANGSTNTVPQSRLEVNFLRMVLEAEKVTSISKDWTFQKRVEWLEEKLPELERSPCAPGPDTLKAYRRQVALLRAVLQVEGQSSDPASSPALLAGGPTVPPAPAPGVGGDSGGLTQQIQHRTRAQVTARLRRQLLGGSEAGSDSMRTSLDDGFEDRLANDEKRRDLLLDAMLATTRQWKEQSKVAGNIIKKDIETLDRNSTLADTNQARLKTEADRLTAFNQRACNCWIWLMLLIVCCSFISMVLFIKLFPKRIYIQQ